MILDTIAEKTRERVKIRKQTVPLEQLRKEAEQLSPDTGFPFERALGKEELSFICEVKKASPSKGLIAPDFPYLQIAGEYEAAGASAISVLTEPEFFLGSDQYLKEIAGKVSIPVLRKDFTVDEYQIYEAKVLGASAVLLICSLLDMEQLKRYMGICGRLGLSSLVEAHTDREVAMAAEAGADIIGINNRNLGTFEVDFTNALRLRKLVDRGTIFVAESGIRTPEDIELLAENQVDAVLVGETLMRAADKKQALRELKSRIR